MNNTVNGRKMQLRSIAPRFSSVKLRFGSNRNDDLLYEVPQHLEVMAARLRNGESVHAVLASQADRGGKFSQALERLTLRITYGESIEEALKLLDEECESAIVSEFANKIALGLRRGSPMAEQFVQLAESSRGRLRVLQLKNAGRNELKMLVPLVFMILPVTVLFAIFPSLQILQLGV
jgi:tight adherence protein C